MTHEIGCHGKDDRFIPCHGCALEKKPLECHQTRIDAGLTLTRKDIRGVNELIMV